MVSLAGDFHNFTQAVRRISAPDGSEYFEKPRTLFWERLFFGFDSPLKKYFKGMDEPIFNLKIKFLDESRQGSVEKILAEDNPTLNEDKIRNFGFLLGYCYVFGLQDLHKENLLMTKTGLQVIDLETVFANFVLPNETLLLPFKDTTFERSGLGALFKSNNEISPKNVFTLLEGFISSLVMIEKNIDQILKDIELATEGQKIPVRIILRDTRKYRHWKTITFDPPLFDEELVQLERGDIPYFFKYIGSEELYYYTHLDKSHISVIAPDYFREKLTRIAVEPSVLLKSSKIKSALFPNGTLVILKKLMPSGFTGHHAFSEFEIFVSREKYSVSSSWGRFEASR